MTTLLRIDGLHVRYGSVTALRGVSLHVETGEVVAVLGPNGAGKSTLLRTIAGLNTPERGSIRLRETWTAAFSPERLVTEGISLVPEGRHVFGSLTVKENVMLGATTRTDGKTAIMADLERIADLFPILRQRFKQRAGQLSGGEQQMLAIARALMSSPQLLLLDEPSLGLAPLVVQTVYDVLARLCADGVTLLLVEQNIQLALRVAARAYVLNAGRVVVSGATQELRAMSDIDKAYFAGAA